MNFNEFVVNIVDIDSKYDNIYNHIMVTKDGFFTMQDFIQALNEIRADNPELNEMVVNKANRGFKEKGFHDTENVVRFYSEDDRENPSISIYFEFVYPLSGEMVDYIESSVKQSVSDSAKVTDSSKTIEYIKNFEPYLIDKEAVDDYYGGGVTAQRYPDLYLSIGDKNSDVILYVIVSNITANGGFDSEIDDVENLGVDMDFFNEEFYEAINDFISREVVFDETH